MANYEPCPGPPSPVSESPVRSGTCTSRRLSSGRNVSIHGIFSPASGRGGARVSQHHSTAGPGPESAAVRGDFVLLRNVELLSPGQQSTASSVGEPSVAMNGDVVFYTGNWYAAVSTNGGQNFSFINPARSLPGDPSGLAFCCDQVVHYIPAIDTFVWLMQYGPDTGDNIQRIGFAKTADVAAGKWRLFDLTTAALGVPGAFMDFPDLAVGCELPVPDDQHLWDAGRFGGRADSVRWH